MADKNLFLDYKENPSIELRNRIVEEYLYMVDILIRKYLGKGVEYDDLYQVGAMALVNAVQRFDCEKGFEFSSFATPTILGEIKKYFRDKQWSIKVPRRMKEIIAKVQESKENFYINNQRAATMEELSEDTGFSVETIIEALDSSRAYDTYSLDRTFEEAGDDGENNYLEKYTGFDEKGYERIETSEIIQKVIDKFDDQYKYIFNARFIENRSQAEIAKELGVSQMTISRAERSIIKQFQEEKNKES